MATLHLPLKREWFEMIKAGVKLEEYRECKNYWIYRFSRLCGRFEYYFGKNGIEMILADRLKCNKLVFTIGYAKAYDTSRRLELKNPKIRKGPGKILSLFFFI